MANIEQKNIQTLLKTFARANALPLDKDEVWESITEAEIYLNSPMAYAGQTIKVKMEDGKYQSFTLQPDATENKLILEVLQGFVDESKLKQFVQIVDELPQIGEDKVIYIQTTSGNGYIWNGLEYQIIFTNTAVDISGLARLDGAEFTGEVILASNPVKDMEATPKQYVDGVKNSSLKRKYEITSTPIGTLVDYRDKEIRVMCPVNTEWTEQEVGSTGNANMYYMGFKAYAPNEAVSFKEGDRGVISDKMYTFDDDFAGIDKYGRKYSICWLALASCDNEGNWTYFGKNSSIQKYIGWDYVVEWYDANGVVIQFDQVRINLSNEDCHAQIEPSYLFKAKTEAISEANAYTDKALAWGEF